MQKIIFFIGLLMGTLAVSGQKVVVYPGPEGLETSPVYTVEAGGKKVFVYQSMVAPFASFDFEGKVEVKIRANRDVKWVDVRPKSLGIVPVYKDSMIYLTLDKPCNLSIELNGEPRNNPLFLFTNPPETDRPDLNDPDVISFEPGKVHVAGVIRVKSGQTLYIPGGTIVHGVIVADSAENIKVMGRGIMDGSRVREFKVTGPSSRFPTRFVNFLECNKVLLKDLIFINAVTWQIAPVHCEDLTVQNIRIASENNSDDGIDIVRSRNVLIDHVFIFTKDDCIAVKAHLKFPRTVNTENVLVKNSVFWNTVYGNALEIGFELWSEYVRNITFRDSDVIHCEDGAVFSIHNGDNATVENILFENIRIEDGRQKLVDLAVFYGQYSQDKPVNAEDRIYLNGAWDGILYITPEQRQALAANRGHIRKVTFRNIALTDGFFPFSILSGFDKDHLVEDILFENLTVRGKKITNAAEARLFMENTRGVVFQ